MFDLIIRGGRVITASDSFIADVSVRDGKIAALGTELPGSAPRVIDASGLFVFPGGVDGHTHMEEPFMGTVSSDDFYTGTLAGAAGGVTTIIDYAYQEPGKTLSDAAGTWMGKARSKAVIDYGFHLVVTDLETSSDAEVRDLMVRGYPSMKLFLCYEGLKQSDATLVRMLKNARAAGGLVLVHAENDALVEALIRDALLEGHTEPCWVARCRPKAAEIEAVFRAVSLAESIDAPLLVVHMSVAEGVDHLRRARRRGARVFAETCPKYLLLTEDKLEGDWYSAAGFTCAPPLRDREETRRLWDRLSAGEIDIVSTDHDCFDLRGRKDLGRDRFDKIPLGMPGIETRLPLLFTYGVGSGKISLNRFVDLCSTAPAKIFGLYPEKGTIAPGSDADLVLFDPHKKVVLGKDVLHQHVDYCPYEGTEVTGYPVVTISRGEVVFDRGIFSAEKGRGRFIPRKPFEVPRRGRP
jgi:dihydropyrimidinase